MTNSKKEKYKIDEYLAYSKILEAQITKELNKCKHMKTKMTEFTTLEKTSLEVSELTCKECGEYLGLAYRKVKDLRVERVTTKIIQLFKNKNYYIIKEK